ncbi:hypothetical protein B0T18DRAFT_422651 [Schizothecium vesticola]|uniref:DUF1308 domain-containing protein n=1 Tax=Schizothecium vesticola TaxID=314040 RepID=A0AA40BR32_9PEZI|nr:hypothetical protein B0T18DRAFT_422651 [Schizothecium vesticola]
MATPDNPPHALGGDALAAAAAALNRLGVDDPAVIDSHPVQPPRSTPTEVRGDDDDDSGKNNDRDHALDGAVKSLITQWHVCIDELRQLQEATPASSPIHGLSNLLKAQQQTLDKMRQRRAAGKLSHDNYAAFKSVCWYDRWALIKKCHDLIYFDNVSFPRSPRAPVIPGVGWIRYKNGPFQERPVVIDAVVDSGATWLKFMSISTRTLEFQVLSDDTESDDEATGALSGHSIFVEAITKIVNAAQWNHCPHVHLVLPRLMEGESDVVDKVLSAVRNMTDGQVVKITISCANSKFMTSNVPELSVAIPALVGGRELFVGEDCRRLTPVVNLDPTVLTSLVSDLHHGPIPLQPQAQQELIVYTQSALHNDDVFEESGQVPRNEILAKVLLPALRGRKLVCTKFAAKYFRQLIATISTSSEEFRASLILPSEGAETPHDELVAELQKWSNVTIPHDLLLPIEIVDDITVENVERLVSSKNLPPMALEVARDLSPLNRSIYLYGWANRMTTVTGHRGIHRQVQLSVARHWKPGPDDRPPDVWHRLLSGSLFLREKPTDWRDLIPGMVAGGEVPPELMRWTLPWTTWGRGIDANGVPDTKTWPGVGHEEMLGYGRKTERRARDILR